MKKWHGSGVESGSAKLTEEQVRHLRYQYANSRISMRDLSKQHGIRSVGSLGPVLTGRAYPNVEPRSWKEAQLPFLPEDR